MLAPGSLADSLPNSSKQEQKCFSATRSDNTERSHETFDWKSRDCGQVSSIDGSSLPSLSLVSP